jgi:hypothetical protein
LKTFCSGEAENARAVTDPDGKLDSDRLDYLERTGELDDPEAASRVLLETVEIMVRHGERRRLMLSNRAIDAYKRFKSERHLMLVS